MPTNDVVDPSVQEADLRATRAKESLLSRIHLLKRRFTDAKQQFNPQEHIARYPIPAVGAAFALGVIAGLRRGRPGSSGDARSSLTGAVFAGLAAVALRMVREVAMTQLGHAAHDWWTARDGASAADAQAGGSRMRDAEPFLEH
jgi:hypothetical protein